MSMDSGEDAKGYLRLGDRILEAMKLSLEQKDVAISELLKRALEMAMTRGAGGRAFIERREFSAELEAALRQFESLRKESKGL